MTLKTRSSAAYYDPAVTAYKYNYGLQTTHSIAEAVEFGLGLAMPDPTLPVGVGTMTETINSTNGRQRMNACLHVSSKVVRYPAKKLVWVRPYGPWWFVTAYLGTQAPIAPLPLLETVVTEQFRKEAWQNIMPRLNDGTSLFNFLYELKDVVHLLKLVRRLHKLALFSKRGESIISTKTAAEVHLNVEFGIKPFIRDLLELIPLLSKTEKAIDKFIADGLKKQPYHFTKVVESETDSSTVFGWGYHKRERSSVYHATALISYDYTRPSFLEGFVRLLGLNPTPERIWNAIPYTFLIDWIIKVGDSLVQLDKDPNITVRVHDYCDTLKRVSRSTVMADWKTGSATAAVAVGGANMTNEPLIYWEDSHYERLPGTPNMGYALPVADSLSGRELVLAGALLRAHY